MTARRKIFHSYTSRLALLYAAIFSASTLLLFYFFYLFTAPHMAQQVDNTIQAEIQGLAERYDNEGLDGLVALIADRVDRQKARGTGNSIYLLTNYTFKPLVGNLDRWPKNATVSDDWIEFGLVINQETNQTHLARAKIFRLPGGFGLLVGRDINQLIEVKRRITQALTWGFAIMLLLAVIGGLILGRRTVRKIERINQTARNIMSGDLSQRVPLTGSNDDFDQVADNLNRMLDCIQSLMEDIRRVSDSIAHDLRTPLARLRQHLEEARRRETPHSESARLLAGAIQEADSLLSTFASLLRIARIESGQIQSGFSQIEFRALIEDIIEFYEPLAEDKQQRIDSALEPGIEFFGDRDLLFQAVANLIENAIKYTPQRGRIDITLTRLGADAIITVADDGPGIPESERENVFRRFYRLDQSRSASDLGGGNGLGLSMVSAVVAMHNGRIELQDNHPGLRTVVTLPLAAQSEESGAADEEATTHNEPPRAPSVGQAA